MSATAAGTAVIAYDAGPWALATCLAAVLSMRATYRLASPAGQPVAHGCRSCGAAFRSGPAGWFTIARCCRVCRQRHRPPVWAIAVLATGASTVLTYRAAPADPAGRVLLIAWHVFAVAGVMLSVIDVAVLRLPTPIIAVIAAGAVPAVIAAAVLRTDTRLLVDAGGGAAALGGAYLLLFVASNGGIGAGDVRLAVVTGWLTGALSWHSVLTAAIVPHLIVGPVAVTALARARITDSRLTPLPFGPFLIVGALTAAAMHH